MSMAYLLLWWALLVLLGLAAFPIAFRFFKYLPDRGYPFIKPLALLLVAYPFWLLTSLGLLQNTFGAAALTVFLLAALAWGYGFWKRDAESPLTWLRRNWQHTVIVEAVFAIAFLAFAYYRAFNPEIQATEKPMEFMFVNSILKSPTFPPHDSWLSGYAISYYYLGYVMAAFLTRLTAVPSNYAFNLALTMIYALSATGAFGLTYNLIRWVLNHRAAETRRPSPSSAIPYVFGGLAVIFLLVMGNLEAPFESLHNANIGSDAFYKWLDVNGLANVEKSGTFEPKDNWWWWRSSRVVNDHNPTDGSHVEVIDEFPSFSFLLGDLHPHVLALPFGLLALAVAFNLFLLPVAPTPGLTDALGAWRTPAALGSALVEVVRPWLTSGMLLTAVIVGGLSMLNTWDIATYGFIVVAAFALAQFRAAGRWSLDGLIKAGLFGVGLLVTAYLLYLPFYLGFTSQAGGILPNVYSKTPLQQYLMMFGLFIFVLATLVFLLIWQQGEERTAILGEAITWVSIFLALPLLIAVGGAVVLLASSNLRALVMPLLGITVSDAGQAVLQVLRMYVIAFAYSLVLFLLLAVLMGGLIALVRRWIGSKEPVQLPRTRGADQSETPRAGLNPGIVFVLLLAFTGLLLTFGVEFLYIRDTFGTRMNTVFKLYFQAWTLFSIAAAFGAFYIWSSTRGVGKSIWLAALGLIVLLSLVFPFFAYPSRTGNFKANAGEGTPTLDGTLWIKNAAPDLYAGIQWLNEHAPNNSVVLEAPGADYQFTNQASMATGLPTLVGWGGHELQWRGSGDEAGKREADAEKIYTAMDATQARSLLQQYGVNYVIVGQAERDKYKLATPMIEKFARMGQLVFNQGSMRIYQINP
ncbi:MAG: DUF2298 domain-containing protein [Anaerolineae bacterium]